MFIGPFAILYIFPQFFLVLERNFFTNIKIPSFFEPFSKILMYGGAAIAIWCALIMWFNKRTSPNVFSKPLTVVSTGPYKVVRHPMMWALFITLAGEVVYFGSPFLFIWLLIWIRVSVLYIERYEEPYLNSVFGQKYIEYCEKTPRWIPYFKKI